ncbi:MAG: hypothetical protein U1E40_06045 [Amaricoccus sp.]
MVRRIAGALAGLALLAWAGAAAADCYVNGQWVQEGSQLGGQTCENGQWVTK